MKITLLIAAILVLGSCTRMINSSDPQVSENIEASKKDGVLVKEYRVARADGDIQVEEAWIEKIWYSNLFRKGATSPREVTNRCGLYFRIKQTRSLKFRIDNSSDWSMTDIASNKKVGNAYDAYSLSLHDCQAPDTIVLDLTYEKGKDPFTQGKPSGKLVFVAK